MFYGDIPSGSISLASCDSKYLYDHAPALVASCAISKNPLHLHVINANDDDWAFMQNLRIRAKKLNPNFRFTLTSEDTDVSDLDQEQRRTYYACNRFIVANQLLNLGLDKIFITDVDSLFMKHVDFPDADVGLYIREPLATTNRWEHEGTRVAAGAVFYDRTALLFAQEVINLIMSGDLRWFLDQIALNMTYQKYKDQIRVHHFDSNFMDWEFREGTTIWTGKGPRKYDNPIYVAKKNEFTNMLPSAEEAVWQKS